MQTKPRNVVCRIRKVGVCVAGFRVCCVVCVVVCVAITLKCFFAKELAPQHTATLCNTLRQPATHKIYTTRRNTLRHTGTHRNTQEHINTYTAARTGKRRNTHRNTPQHTAIHRNTPQYTLQHTATHCNTLKHTQHSAIHTETHTKQRAIVRIDALWKHITLRHTATHRNTP